MEENQLKETLKELVEKSKEYKDGFLTPKECRIKISELNYNFCIYHKLEETNRELWTRTSSNREGKETLLVPALKIEGDYVSFFPRIIREYLKEIS